MQPQVSGASVSDLHKERLDQANSCCPSSCGLRFWEDVPRLGGQSPAERSPFATVTRVLCQVHWGIRQAAALCQLSKACLSVPTTTCEATSPLSDYLQGADLRTLTP